MISNRAPFPIVASSLSCVLVVILLIFPNSNFLGVVGFLVVVVVTCVVDFILGFVVGLEGSEVSVEELIVTVEVVEVCFVGLVKDVFIYGQNTRQN